MSCHICIRTGERTCDPQEADLKCMVCGWCERQAIKQSFLPEETP